MTSPTQLYHVIQIITLKESKKKLKEKKIEREVK